MAQTQNPTELLDRMVAAGSFSAGDAAELARQSNVSLQSEDDILRWLAGEYDVSFTALDDIEPDRQLLSFPARILLKEELLPLRRVNGSVEIATSRLFATQGLDALKTLTGLSLKPVLAPAKSSSANSRNVSALGRTRWANLPKSPVCKWWMTTRTTTMISTLTPRMLRSSAS